MRCRKCRAEISDAARFCPVCGAKQDTAKKPKTRGNGTGSVYQLPNKTWIAIRTIGYEPQENGKNKRITRSKSGFKTKKEAVEYLPFVGTGKRVKKKTFLDVYEAWEPTCRAGKDTLNCYKAAKKHFKRIWNLSFGDLTVDDLQDCIDDCEKGKRTRQNMKTMCGLLYKYAIPRKLADMNMAQYLVVSGEDGGGKDGLPEEAVKKISESVGKVPGADYVLCQCYLGFRPSELLALDAINYNRKEKAFVGGSKTDAGKDRVVTVSPKIQPIIDQLVKDKMSGPVFCKDGKKMSIKQYRAMFYEVLDACGVDNPIETKDGVERRKYTPHSCRHTFATMMKRVDGSDKDKLELIGHTSAEMLRHYQDVSFEDLRRITDAI